MLSVIRVPSFTSHTPLIISQDCTTQDPIEGFYKYEGYIQTGISSAQTFLAHVEEVGMDEISDQCGAPVRPIVEGIGLVKDNLGILLSGEHLIFIL
jgi:hypothetical protein